MESRPVKTIPIHDHLRGKLCDLYENDCIFDKFECVWSGDDKYVSAPIVPLPLYLSLSFYSTITLSSPVEPWLSSELLLNDLQPRHVLTGSYHNFFRIFDTDSSNDVVLQADKSAFKAKKIGAPAGKNGLKNGPRPGGLRDAMQTDTLDFNKKILHASWHPRENTIAVSVGFFI
jgi:serine/threonine-protein phosphatase 2A regulatory subunit B